MVHSLAHLRQMMIMLRARQWETVLLEPSPPLLWKVLTNLQICKCYKKVLWRFEIPQNEEKENPICTNFRIWNFKGDWMMRCFCTINYREMTILTKKLKKQDVPKERKKKTGIMTFVGLQNTNIKMIQEIYHTSGVHMDCSNFLRIMFIVLSFETSLVFLV